MRGNGVKLVIASDAHSTPRVRTLAWGVTVARRAWATPADVLNTQPVEALRGIACGATAARAYPPAALMKFLPIVDRLGEIRRLYFATTRATIERISRRRWSC